MTAQNLIDILHYISQSWNEYNTYEINQLVTVGDSVYMCLEINSNINPTSDETKWLLLTSTFEI